MTTIERFSILSLLNFRVRKYIRRIIRNIKRYLLLAPSTSSKVKNKQNIPKFRIINVIVEGKDHLKYNMRKLIFKEDAIFTSFDEFKDLGLDEIVKLRLTGYARGSDRLIKIHPTSLKRVHEVLDYLGYLDKINRPYKKQLSYLDTLLAFDLFQFRFLRYIVYPFATILAKRQKRLLKRVKKQPIQKKLSLKSESQKHGMIRVSFLIK
jgi:hypothetical protein